LAALAEAGYPSTMIGEVQAGDPGPAGVVIR
jgi:hypothetical protein